MTKKKKRLYPGTEAVLYLIVALVCNLCLKKLKDFSLFKKKYTEDYVNAILDSLAAAKALPSYKSGAGVQSAKRKQLVSQNKSVLRFFQKLMRYLEDGFEESVWEDMRQVAGGDLYDAAGNHDWKASTDLQEAMNAFMNLYADELAKGDMPDTFPTDFAKLSDSFAADLLLFDTSKTSSGGETDVRLNANNALYKSIRGVMDDGVEIFADEPAMVDQFTYQWLMRKLGKQGDTGFRFSLREAETLVAVTAASVQFLPSGELFDEVNEEGVILVHLPELGKGESYSFLLTAPGYDEVAGTLMANTGVMHRVDLILKKAVMSVDPSGERKVG